MHRESHRDRAASWRRDGPSLGDELRRASDSMARLVRSHLGLAKLELREEARKTGIDTGIGLSALPFAFAGLLMLDVALALGLAEWLGGAWAFLIVGALNMALAGTLGVFAAARLQKRRRMEGLSEELDKDRRMLRDLGGRLRGPGRQPRAAAPQASPSWPASPPTASRDPEGRPVAEPSPPAPPER